MELALAGDGFRAGVGEEQHLRIKLHFEDSSILSAEQVQDGLTRSWFLVRGLPRTIGDLAANIVLAFRLLQTCPNGISLQMEDFTLPPSEPVGILKDKEIVRIRKRNFVIDAGCQQISSSFDTLDRSARLGVKCSALEEFERETGGYESEQEDIIQDCQDNCSDMSLGAASKKSKQKKRKRARNDDQGNLKLEVVPYTGDHTGGKEKERKSTKQKLTLHEDWREEGSKSKKKLRVVGQHDQNALDQKECRLDMKEQQIEYSERKRNKKDKANQRGSNALPEVPAVEKEHPSKSNHKVVSVSSSSGEDEKKQTENGSTKKPSRSSLRKKAKRRWRREHAAELAKKGSENLTNGPMEVTKDVSTCPTKPEDDGDAEEERLPYVVRPGHLRFQPSDEDNDTSVRSHQPLTSIDWTHGISKRQGQSWGQEKSRKGNIQAEEIGDMDICHSRTIDYETFPSLENGPQDGDIIAYRIVELTPSCCPELSEYRVGKVCNLETQSGSLKLVEVPEYPLSRQPNDDDAREDQDRSTVLPSSYDEQGFLEIEISSLAHVRLISGGARDTYKIQTPAEPITHMNEQPNISTAELRESVGAHETHQMQASTEPITHSIAQPNVSTAEGGDDIVACETYEMQASAEPINHTIAEPTISIEAVERVSMIPESLKINTTIEAPSTATDSGSWMELSQELERKKEELANKGGSISNDAVQRDHKSMGNGHCTDQKEADSFRPKGRAGWHRRAGGLGSTIALLRSQHPQNSS